MARCIGAAPSPAATRWDLRRRPTPGSSGSASPGQVLRHPDWSDERQVADLRRQIDRALELGYDVLVVRLWDMDLAQLEVATGMVADSRRLAALRGLLHSDYVGHPGLHRSRRRRGAPPQAPEPGR